MSHNCHPPFCPSLSVPVASRLAFEFQSAQDALLCLFEGDGSEGGGGVSSGNWSCFAIRIQRDQWAAHVRLVGAFSGGHEALTAARGANPALHSSHIAFPPLVILLTPRTQAAQSITASPSFSFHRLPRSRPAADSSSGQPLPAFHLSTLRLMLASSFSVNPPNTSVCVIVLDSSWWRGYLARPSWYRAKGLLSTYLQPQTSVLSIFSL